MQPVLTLLGKVEDPERGLKLLVEYYFKCVETGKQYLGGRTFSFVKDLQEKKPEEAIRNSLTELLRQHFDEVVEIEVTQIDTHMNINIHVMDGGESIALDQLHESIDRVLIEGDN